MPRERFDRPVDHDVVDREKKESGVDGESGVYDSDAYDSDVYELRTCYRCDAFLPLDKPARLVGLTKATAKPCCDGCYELYH